ncbi:hypothetical protein D0817_20700 [Flavobacterium cupreum]|uniref:Uncharacterized protein n=1 Tax=Flavobacterium cupreum TaxID=2133766 RepID=A0A434A2K4_9FLAO|nr:hypothetical protein [Flavobacterium cupreum]RUT68547.1 hypothetical protein D0817_20700 [Flavobacterium cupreum]
MRDEYFDYMDEIRQSKLDEQRYIDEKIIYRNYKIKQRRKIVGLTLMTLGIIAYISIRLLTNIENIYSTILGLFSIITGIAIVLLNYLQNDYTSTRGSYSEINNYLLIQLEELKLELQKFKKKTGVLDDDKSIDNSINNIINKIFNKDYIQNKIEKSFTENAVKSSRLDNLFNEFEKTSYRINDELIRLRKSANINLVIGSLSTTIAIFSLTYEVFFSEVNFTETVNLLSHYIPRISLVIFIEIFAFFFLKLYKSNLLEIKYFNNEKTNIDFKLITLKTALFQEDLKMIRLCLSELIKTERNFILKKDESTVEIEKFKVDKNDNQLIASLVEKLLMKK